VSDDYLNLLAPAAISCAPRGDSAEAGHILLDIDFPEGPVADAEGYAQLEDRLQPLAYFVLGIDTLFSHASLGEGSSCVQHVPSDSPFFAIAGVEKRGISFRLHLSPASPMDVFSYLSMKLEHDPDTQREVARRRAEGLPEGRKLAQNWDQSVAKVSLQLPTCSS
jgi:hypothetical protein